MADFYTSKRIVATCRRILNDKIEPYFVSDDDLLDFLNRRAREACEEALVLFTSERYKVKAKADDPWVPAVESIIKVKQLVSAAGKEVCPVPQSRVMTEETDSDYGQTSLTAWRSRTGPPEHLVMDMEEGRWRLVPIPTEDTEYLVEGWMYPDAVCSLEDNLDLPDRVLGHLHLGVLASAFGIEDADAIYDPKKEAQYERRWALAILDMKAKRERDQRDTGRSVRYGGY